MAMSNDDPRKAVVVALVLCLVCSVVVSTASVVLRPLQEANRALDRRVNILDVAGLLQPGADVDVLFERFETRVVDLASGEFSDAVDPLLYDQRRAARDPDLGEELAADSDPANIGRRARLATVYLLREGGDIVRVILPVHGYGLWSTMYGFLALEGDLNTVVGLRFYEHAETPGLGAEVDNPLWRRRWEGKMVYDESGVPRIEVVKGSVDPASPDARHQVDGLAGSTLTGRGVTNLLRYWLGDDGFGRFIARLRSRST
ncbi:MAG: Na(+)-translocating NADH-quinone reductase subunit C [Pseudomonadales bacterium]|nr:Na(+)-translocating NADH-quinone reductase subunit C [Pseudomonadales bacterium]NIX07325.1 Na(+)-translocating NADH-quinone reductase subunit C [Pseudomonadales bacterium]